MKILITAVINILIYVTGITSVCNMCQSTNYVACHKKNVYSLCINGIPTEDFITCPENHVCTDGPYVCYPPLSEAKPSCISNTNLCGVCNKQKVYACINETTIAFCYGADKPVEGAELSYCLGDTVCDIFSTKGFCTKRHLAKPSCVTQSNDETTATVPITTELIITTTAEVITTTITNTMGNPTTTTIATEPTSATTESTATNQTTTELAISTETEQTTIRETEPIITITNTEQTTTIATEPTTTIKSTKPPITTTTTNNPKPRDPITICKDAGKIGTFYADDPTCKSFVVCYFQQPGKITGIKRNCPNDQYFLPDVKICTANKPDICI